MANNSPHSLVLKAREALTRGDLRAAETAAEERLKLAGRDIDALQIRYLVQKNRGQVGEAVRTLGQVIGITSRADWAYNDLIELLVTHGKRVEAEQVARAALRANPRNPQAHNLFGMLLSELNDLPSGEWHFRRALELAGEQAPYLLNLALSLMKQGRTDEADRYFARAHQLSPQDMKVLAYWSSLHEATGDLNRAKELLDRAEALSSPAEVNLLRAEYLSRSGRPQDALAILNSAGTLAGDGQLARGRLHDRLGRYDEAWQDFVEGKRKLAREAGGLQYRADAVEAFFSRLKQFYRRENLDLLPKANRRTDVAQPIFIMGFPRSGTTLVEQILCSHSAVLAGGELTFLGELRKLANHLFPSPEGAVGSTASHAGHSPGHAQMGQGNLGHSNTGQAGPAQPFPENLAQSWTADNRYAATLFRDYYLARAEQYGLLAKGPPGGAPDAAHGERREGAQQAARQFFTDKMPFNEIYLPLLRMAFPEAKIVRVVRHPLDVCVSMLSNNMTHGFNCGYRMEDIAHHLAAVGDLVEHYGRELAPAEHILRYETLVEDQAGQTKLLLDYLGLPFEDACLRFHENRRYAPTPSYAQVSEKLNDRSVGRHRHYAQHLKPYVPRLERLMAAYGYR